MEWAVVKPSMFRSARSPPDSEFAPRAQFPNSEYTPFRLLILSSVNKRNTSYQPKRKTLEGWTRKSYFRDGKIWDNGHRPISAKRLGYSPFFWTWRILVSARNRSELREMAPIFFQMISTTFQIVGEGMEWIPKGPKSADFEQKDCKAFFSVSIWGEFETVKGFPFFIKNPGL